MTSRIDAIVPTTTTDSKMSDSEAARAQAEAAHHAENRRRAAWVVAACARDTAEFRTLAGMLGLEREDCEAARTEAETRRSGHKAA